VRAATAPPAEEPAEEAPPVEAGDRSNGTADARFVAGGDVSRSVDR
jgi:hypothetical protein